MPTKRRERGRPLAGPGAVPDPMIPSPSGARPAPAVADANLAGLAEVLGSLNPALMKFAERSQDRARDEAIAIGEKAALEGKTKEYLRDIEVTRRSPSG